MSYTIKLAKDIKRGDKVIFDAIRATVVRDFDYDPTKNEKVGLLWYVCGDDTEVDCDQYVPDDPVIVEAGDGDYIIKAIQDVKEGDTFLWGVHNCLAVSNAQYEELNNYTIHYCFKKRPGDGVSYIGAEKDFPIIVKAQP